jgi:hypothetical protein
MYGGQDEKSQGESWSGQYVLGCLACVFASISVARSRSDRSFIPVIYTQRKKLLRIRFVDSHICNSFCQTGLTGLRDFCLFLSFQKKLRKRNPLTAEGDTLFVVDPALATFAVSKERSFP